MTMSISEYADAGGVGVETVRYYQRRELLRVPPRASGPRRYGDIDLRRLLFIRAAQAAGFSLTEIARLLDLDATGDRSEALQIAQRRITVLDDKIASLEASRNALKHLAERCGSGTTGPCPILEAFEPG